MLKDHVESTHALLEQWEQQAQKQPVVPGASESYFSFFRAPLTAYQQVIEVIEVVETASKQSLESFEKAMQQGREQLQEVARRTWHSTEKPEK